MANEKRLIDANALCDRITATFPAMPANAMYVAIEKAPTVDAVEVVHARWEHNSETGNEVCSNCGFEWWDGCQECGIWPSATHYCPNCGAKMDGVGNGN